MLTTISFYFLYSADAGITKNIGMENLKLAWVLEGLFCKNCKKHNAINMNTTMLVQAL